jgi:hypothetical protein
MVTLSASSGSRNAALGQGGYNGAGDLIAARLRTSTTSLSQPQQWVATRLVAIHDRALTAGEVGQNYTRG